MPRRNTAPARRPRADTHPRTRASAPPHPTTDTRARLGDGTRAGGGRRAGGRAETRAGGTGPSPGWGSETCGRAEGWPKNASGGADVAARHNLTHPPTRARKPPQARGGVARRGRQTRGGGRGARRRATPRRPVGHRRRHAPPGRGPRARHGLGESQNPRQGRREAEVGWGGVGAAEATHKPQAPPRPLAGRVRLEGGSRGSVAAANPGASSLSPSPLPISRRGGAGAPKPPRRHVPVRHTHTHTHTCRPGQPTVLPFPQRPDHDPHTSLAPVGDGGRRGGPGKGRTERTAGRAQGGGASARDLAWRRTGICT